VIYRMRHAPDNRNTLHARRIMPCTACVMPYSARLQAVAWRRRR
jgi:hypothetical protein